MARRPAAGFRNERASAPPAAGGEVPALDECRERLAQRGARDAELAAELALGRQLVARGEQAELDRRPEPLQVSSYAVWDRTGANTASTESEGSGAHPHSGVVYAWEMPPSTMKLVALT